MNDQTTVIRWRRAGRRSMTLWHLETPTLSDTEGRTGCGRRFPRKDAETGAAADGALCRACLRALGGAVPTETWRHE